MASSRRYLVASITRFTTPILALLFFGVGGVFVAIPLSVAEEGHLAEDFSAAALAFLLGGILTAKSVHLLLADVRSPFKWGCHRNLQERFAEDVVALFGDEQAEDGPNVVTMPPKKEAKKSQKTPKKDKAKTAPMIIEKKSKTKVDKAKTAPMIVEKKSQKTMKKVDKAKTAPMIVEKKSKKTPKKVDEAKTAPRITKKKSQKTQKKVATKTAPMIEKTKSEKTPKKLDKAKTATTEETKFEKTPNVDKTGRPLKREERKPEKTPSQKETGAKSDQGTQTSGTATSPPMKGTFKQKLEMALKSEEETPEKEEETPEKDKKAGSEFEYVLVAIQGSADQRQEVKKLFSERDITDLV